MKTKAFFEDISTKNNILLLKPKDELVKDFSEKYSNFQDKFFYEQFIYSGGCY
ncbi:MAG: hypothetical protein Q4B86_04625 [Eubacteriales bacterium]|nr:hypothetical protein [Eubacteriales bacterium]